MIVPLVRRLADVVDARPALLTGVPEALLCFGGEELVAGEVHDLASARPAIEPVAHRVGVGGNPSVQRRRPRLARSYNSVGQDARVAFVAAALGALLLCSSGGAEEEYQSHEAAYAIDVSPRWRRG